MAIQCLIIGEITQQIYGGVDLADQLKSLDGIEVLDADTSIT